MLFGLFILFGFVYPTGFRVFKYDGFAKIVLIRSDRFAVVCDNREVESFHERKSIAYGKSGSRLWVKPEHIASHMNVEFGVKAGFAVIINIIAYAG